MLNCPSAVPAKTTEENCMSLLLMHDQGQAWKGACCSVFRYVAEEKGLSPNWRPGWMCHVDLGAEWGTSQQNQRAASKKRRQASGHKGVGVHELHGGLALSDGDLSAIECALPPVVSLVGQPPRATGTVLVN